MTYYADLGTVTMVASGPHVRAVGWLDDRQAYPRGKLSGPLIEKLRHHARDWLDCCRNLHWGLFKGRHTCELCSRFESSGNFGVPGDGVLFVCPEMITHYVEGHGYLPPASFLEALELAPLPGTRDHAQALRPFDRVPLQPADRSMAMAWHDLFERRVYADHGVVLEHPTEERLFSLLAGILKDQLSTPKSGTESSGDHRDMSWFQLMLQPTRPQAIVLFDALSRFARRMDLPRRKHPFSILLRQLVVQLEEPDDPGWEAIRDAARRELLDSGP